MNNYIKEDWDSELEDLQKIIEHLTKSKMFENDFLKKTEKSLIINKIKKNLIELNNLQYSKIESIYQKLI